MVERNFRAMLEAQWDQGHFVCVGLDSEWSRLPSSISPSYLPPRQARDAWKAVIDFNCALVDATADIVCAYKLNSAFYEELGNKGFFAQQVTIQYIQQRAPGVPIILDAKRADIGNTNNGYVHAIFDELSADAITVHPYLGREAMKPFLDRKDKGVIVLCRTSNPGAAEFQDLPIDDGKKLYEEIARNVAVFWNTNGNCAVVVGATYPEELRNVREIVGDIPILIPGIGAQGGDVEKTVRAGLDSRKKGIIVNSSRGIIFASSGSDFVEAARRETLKLHEAINQYR